MVEGQIAGGMPCPVCRVDLVMTSRDGVEIDYCPKCRGVWLDRGELDKIIERSAAPPAEPAFMDRPSGRPDDDQRHHPRDYDPNYGRGRGWDDDDDRRHGYGRRGRRGSWLGDMFDFGD